MNFLAHVSVGGLLLILATGLFGSIAGFAAVVLAITRKQERGTYACAFFAMAIGIVLVATIDEPKDIFLVACWLPVASSVIAILLALLFHKKNGKRA